MLRVLSLLLCACAFTATARASDPVTPLGRVLAPATPIAPTLPRPVGTSAARSLLERAAPAVPRRTSRYVLGRRQDQPPASPDLPSVQLDLSPGASDAGVAMLLEVARPQTSAATFAVRDSLRPGGERTEVVLDAPVLVVPFVQSDRDEPAANCRAGGRVLAGTAGLALQASPLWACRMQMTRQALHSFTGETMARRYSVSLQRRF